MSDNLAWMRTVVQWHGPTAVLLLRASDLKASGLAHRGSPVAAPAVKLPAMNLHLTAEEQTFQTDAQAFLAAHWDSTARLMPGPRKWALERRYFAALAESGWLVGHWPRAAGGLQWSERFRWLWEGAAAAAGAPQPSAHGPDLLGPLLLREGSVEQQEQHLPGISTGRVRWCQAFAENSGALDLTAIATSARRQGESWVLNGEKPWVLDVGDAKGAVGPLGVPVAAEPIWLYVLARIETGQAPPPSTPESAAGDSALGVFLVAATSPGVVVAARPMIGETQGSATVCAVSFADVELSAAALLGAPGQGAPWARQLEQAELTLTGGVARNALLYTRLHDFVAGGEWDGGSLWADEDYVAKLHTAEIELAALAALEARAWAAGGQDQSAGAGQADFAQAARLALAARSAELGQTLADLQVEALGYFALPMVDFSALDNEGSIGPEFAQPALLGMLSDRARGVIGAPREHLKNLIAKSVLDLPDLPGPQTD